MFAQARHPSQTLAWKSLCASGSNKESGKGRDFEDKYIFVGKGRTEVWRVDVIEGLPTESFSGDQISDRHTQQQTADWQPHLNSTQCAHPGLHNHQIMSFLGTPPSLLSSRVCTSVT